MRNSTILLLAALSLYAVADDPFLGHKGETGFITVTPQQDVLFYWFFPSQADPSKDPLVIWLTGGPGCSSELAIFMENGPFKIDPSTLKLSFNDYSWNKGANLIYVSINQLGQDTLTLLGPITTKTKTKLLFTCILSSKAGSINIRVSKGENFSLLESLMLDITFLQSLPTSQSIKLLKSILLASELETAL